MKVTIKPLSCLQCFLLSDDTTLTFDLDKQHVALSYHGNRVLLKLAIQSLYCLDDFSSMKCYDFQPLTLKNNNVLPFLMVIMWIKLYDPEVYPAYNVFLLSDATTLTFKNHRIIPLIMVI
jgi:hypothetical protein